MPPAFHRSLILCFALIAVGCSEPEAGVGTVAREQEPQIVVIADPASELGSGSIPVDVTPQPASEMLPDRHGSTPLPLTPESREAPHEAPLEADSLESDSPSGSRVNQRLCIPTTVGLLLVDVDIRVGEQTIDAYLEQRIDEIESEARGDSDALLWPQLLQFVSANPLRFASLNASADDLQSRFDADKNQQVEREELTKFLLREPLGNAAVVVQSHDRYRNLNRRDSPIFRALDQNANSRLEMFERAQAADHLLRLDRNFDQRLDVGEAAELPPAPAMGQVRSPAPGTTAFWLDDFKNWSRLTYALEALYEKAPFGAFRTVARLDRNQDRQLSRVETRELPTLAPHLKLRVELSADQSTPPRLTLLHSAPSVVATVETSPTQLTIQDAELQFTFIVADTLAERSAIPLEAFERLDADQNGMLSEAEIPPQASDQIVFETFDVDQNGGLTLAELRAGLRPEAPLWLAQVRIEASEAADAWFVWLDVNHDGYLSTREIQTATGRLESLDRNADGALDWQEVPDAYQVAVLRREPSDLNRTAQTAAPQASPLPNWAAQLDHNADAEVSWLEFVGTRSQFDALDADRDGFLTADETPR